MQRYAIWNCHFLGRGRLGESPNNRPMSRYKYSVLLRTCRPTYVGTSASRTSSDCASSCISCTVRYSIAIISYRPVLNSVCRALALVLCYNDWNVRHLRRQRCHTHGLLVLLPFKTLVKLEWNHGTGHQIQVRYEKFVTNILRYRSNEHN